MCCGPQAFLKQGEAVSTRCDELQSLVKRGCNVDMIESPKGEKNILRNKPVTNRKKGGEKLQPHEITQIQPQQLNLTLRSGEEPSANIFCSSSAITHQWSCTTSSCWTITLFRGAPDLWLEVQTSRRLPDWPVLSDGPVILNEGWSGECEEPGNKSDAEDVKDHFWLPDRWGCSHVVT